MKALKKMQKYLKACGIECSDVCGYDLFSQFPASVSLRYDACMLTIFGMPRIAFEPKVQESPDELVSVYRKLAAVVHPIAVLDFADSEYSEYLRKSKVNYIVPGRQMYVPPYAVLVPPNAYEWTEKAFLRDFLSPCAQLVFLRTLLFHAKEGNVSYAALQKELSINCVYLTRACQELEYHRLAALDKVGRNRFICLPQERHLLWRSAEKCLRTPVLKRIRYTGNVSNPVTAGYSALSELSDLAPENERIFAMAQSEFRTLEARKIKKYNGVQIEVWRYDPRLLAIEGRVDPLSLYLSLRDSPDARINIAIESLLENVL
jgi:hypothetical protein